MEVYERINLLLQERKLSKKDFATKLRNLEPKLKSTYEVPSEKSIYAYLSGRIGIRIELIPYIAEVLDIPEQFLFDDSERARMMLLKTISKNLLSNEKEFLLQKLGIKEKEKQVQIIPRNIFHSINDLLIYAPEPFLRSIETTLKNYKTITNKFSNRL